MRAIFDGLLAEGWQHDLVAVAELDRLALIAVAAARHASRQEDGASSALRMNLRQRGGERSLERIDQRVDLGLGDDQRRAEGDGIAHVA